MVVLSGEPILMTTAELIVVIIGAVAILILMYIWAIVQKDKEDPP